MSPFELLVRLQGVDRDWDEKARLYESVKKQLADQSELVSRRTAHGRLADELSATRGALRDGELALDSLHERVRKVEAELYSGRVRSPKELENLRKDSEHLRRRISQLEDRVLLAMTQVDELEEAARQGEQELRAFEVEWQETRRSLATQHEALRTSLRQLQQMREELRGQLGRAELGLYDELRAKKAGMALSPVKDRVCQTCRVTVPTYKARMVESRRAIVTCEGCGRILYGG
jgi:predicted  nucleic acid-binding Zn-ribbon protein